MRSPRLFSLCLCVCVLGFLWATSSFHSALAMLSLMALLMMEGLRLALPLLVFLNVALVFREHRGFSIIGDGPRPLWPRVFRWCLHSSAIARRVLGVLWFDVIPARALKCVRRIATFACHRYPQLSPHSTATTTVFNL